MASDLANPILAVQLAFPLDRAIPSWVSKVAWKLVLQKSHSPLRKEKDLLWDLKILEVHMYLP
jgi:hypothetical protein